MLSLLNIACWSIPLLNKNFSQNTLLLSRLNTFAGGIFLSLSFGLVYCYQIIISYISFLSINCLCRHLIPHALEVSNSVGIASNKVFQFVLAGLLLVFFIEKVAFNSHEVLHEYGTATTTTPAAATKSSSGATDKSHSHSSHSHDHSHDHSHTADCNKSDTNILSSPGSTKGTLSTNSALLLLFAMALHSLFETMALGLASDKSSSLFMAFSIALHQPAESIALLVAFLKTNMSVNNIIKFLTIFSFIGPIGVSAGVLLQKSSSPFIQAVVVALTAGTFLYLGATEVRVN